MRPMRRINKSTERRETDFIPDVKTVPAPRVSSVTFIRYNYPECFCLALVYGRSNLQNPKLELKTHIFGGRVFVNFILV